MKIKKKLLIIIFLLLSFFIILLYFLSVDRKERDIKIRIETIVTDENNNDENIEKPQKYEDVVLSDDRESFIFENTILFNEYFDLSQYIDMTNKTMQGMAIGRIGDLDVLCVCTVGNEDRTENVIMWFDLNTKELINMVENLPIGHGNGVTFCDRDNLFYIACAGGKNGSNKVVAYNIDGELCREIDFKDKPYHNPYGIAFNNHNGKFFVVGSEKSYTAYDYDFCEQYAGKIIMPDQDYVAQSIFMDDTIVYEIFNIGNEEKSELYMYRYEEDSLIFKEIVDIEMHGELESMCWYGGKYYLAFKEKTGFVLYALETRDK